MRIRNKMLILMEIAIVLCFVFLVAIPAIAAEQTTQKVSASEVTTASEDETLDIYGNANEDDAIDMRDLTYVKLIFFGKRPETELADAKYDGEINPLDFVQIKLIIVGKEKELTLIDGAERIVTVHKPVERTVHADRTSLELAKIVKVEKDRIVGVDSSIQSGDWKMLFPDYQDISTVGGGGCKAPPDCEAILRLNPDVVFLSLRSNQDACAAVLEYAGITVIRSWYRYGVWGSDIWLDAKKFGYIFDKQDEAEEFCDFLNNYMNPIKETVKEIPEEDKPTAYFESFPYSLQEFSYGSIENAGGKDIFADLEYWGRDIKLEPEEVIERNPDIIFKMGLRATISGKDVGYLIDAGNTAKLEGIKDEIMSRSELQNVKAVKEGRVYVMTGYIMYSGAGSGCRGFLQEAYMAKWLHPELFKAVDPKAIHQEYLTEFLEVDIDLDKKGVFVYPEPS